MHIPTTIPFNKIVGFYRIIMKELSDHIARIAIIRL